MEGECHKNEQEHHRVLEKTQTMKLTWQHVTFQCLNKKVQIYVLKGLFWSC